ncbi:MAG: hypothetical protein ACOZCP_16100, partial [Pseudomonadota bacterium]
RGKRASVFLMTWRCDLAVEGKMAVMMVLMLVALAVLGPGHHFGARMGSHEPAAQSSQSHKHDVEKEKSDPGDGQP